MFLCCCAALFSFHTYAGGNPLTREICKEALGSEWTPRADPRAEAIARSYLLHEELPYTLILCETRLNPLDFASSVRYYRSDWGSSVTTYFVLGLHVRLRAIVGDNIAPVIAHEVGHYSPQTLRMPGECSGYLKHGFTEQYVDCEHDIDMIAVRFVGAPAFSEALRKIVHYLETCPGGHCFGDAVARLNQRIALLGGASITAPDKSRSIP